MSRPTKRTRWLSSVPGASSRSGLQVAHTADLNGSALAAGRALLDAVFGADMTDSDWEHALGGVHALVWEAGELVGHASSSGGCCTATGPCARATSRASPSAPTGGGAGWART